MIKLKDILREYFDAEDILSTLSQKGNPIEYFRIRATSPAGKEVFTGWVPMSDKAVKELTKQLKQQMYTIVGVEKRSITT